MDARHERGFRYPGQNDLQSKRTQHRTRNRLCKTKNNFSNCQKNKIGGVLFF